ncbi:MAG: DUF86 domain-containing protein [Nitrospinae bacterium]|nr:DUF86 domain-containing protein [Nitrospinota bacterium]
MNKTNEIAGEEKKVLDELSDACLNKGSLDPIQLRAAKNSLQVLIENAIGKGKQILKHYNCPVVPIRGRDVFNFMHEMGLISRETYTALIKAVGLRNAMIHDYMDFDNEILARVLKEKAYSAIHEFLTEEPSYNDTLKRRIENFNI